MVVTVTKATRHESSQKANGQHILDANSNKGVTKAAKEKFTVE